jgi:hypothetical protein
VSYKDLFQKLIKFWFVSLSDAMPEFRKACLVKARDLMKSGRQKFIEDGELSDDFVEWFLEGRLNRLISKELNNFANPDEREIYQKLLECSAGYFLKIGIDEVPDNEYYLPKKTIQAMRNIGTKRLISKIKKDQSLGHKDLFEIFDDQMRECISSVFKSVSKCINDQEDTITRDVLLVDSFYVCP